MQKWKDYSIIEKKTDLISNGKTAQDLLNFDDTVLSPSEFCDLLLYTVHPFEIKKYTKIISPIQKAITMIIYQKGGSASEDDIVEFLNRHWPEISSVSKTNFVRKPNPCLVHQNMAVKQRGLTLFVKNPDNPKMVSVNYADANEVSETVQKKEEIAPMKSRKRSRKSEAELNNDGNNSDVPYNESAKDDIDDADDTDDKDTFEIRGRRSRCNRRSKNGISAFSTGIRETRSKKERKSVYNSDDKDKLDFVSSSASAEFGKSSEYHHTSTRSSRRFTIEPVYQQPPSAQAISTSLGSSVGIMKFNSTLLLPPAKNNPPEFPFSSSRDAAKKETGLNMHWDWCNFNMSPAQRMMFYPFSKPLESSENSIQNDTKFDFEIPHKNGPFDEIVIFVVEEACSRAATCDVVSKGITIEQIIEKVKSFSENKGRFFCLPLYPRVKAILLEAKSEKIVENMFFDQKEYWISKKALNDENENSDRIEKIKNKFKLSIPKPFANMKIKELTISQMYEKFSSDNTKDIKSREFVP